MNTRRKFCCGIFFFLLLSTIGMTPRIVRAQAVDFSSVVKRVKPSVVTILCYDASGKVTSQGSGFFVDSTDIVTCYHVLAGAMRAECHDQNDSVETITGIVASFEQADIVKARVSVTHRHRSLALARRAPEEGQAVVVIGTPLGMALTVSNGIVSSVRTDDTTQMKWLQITAPVSEGSSGSPVVNMRGEVVGVAQSVFRNGENLNFASMSEYVRQMHDQSPTALTVWSSGLLDEAAASRSARQEEYGSASPEGSGRSDREHAQASYEFNRGLSYIRQRDFSAALKVFERMVSADSTEARAWFQIGLCHEVQHEFDLAASAYTHAITLRPNDTPPMYHLIESLYNARHMEASVDACQKLLKLAPGDGMAWNLLGRSCMELGWDSLSMRSFQTAATFSPRLAEPHGMMAFYFLKHQDDSSAIREMKIALELDPSPELHDGLADIYSKMGLHSLALAEWRAAFHMIEERGMRRTDSMMIESIGDSLFHNAAYNDVIDLMKMILKGDPNNAAVHDNLGSCYFRQGRTEEALAEYKLAVHADPSFAPGHLDIGIAELELSDKAAALDEYSILQSLDIMSAKILWDAINRPPKN
jgi:S1-C subfamily serine protease/Flp pilus assembly protein TadD